MTKAEFLEICSQHWEEVNSLEEMTSLYELEREFDKIWTELGNEVIEKTISEVPKDHRKKKLLTKYGEIEVSNNCKLSKFISGEKISPYLKEKLVFIGQLDCYERGSEIAKYLMNVQTNDTAIYRLTDQTGQKCEPMIESENFRKEIKLDRGEKMYVQVDGSMLLTREEGWKEVKLGRIFKSSSLLEETPKRKWIRESEYVCHMGSHSEFEDKMSKIIDEVYTKHSEDVIFVGDGAKWQWEWVRAEYPQAVQILDFYHAMEHIGKYVQTSIKGKSEIENSMHEIATMLKEKGIEQVMIYISKIPCDTQAKKEEFKKLKTYIDNNKDKMNYPIYLSKNYLIGSGAIESAHRTVLQKRMKQSGQRWSKKGLTNMINLRTISMSGYWNKVEDLFKLSA